jgi:hypothetical protein
VMLPGVAVGVTLLGVAVGVTLLSVAVGVTLLGVAVGVTLLGVAVGVTLPGVAVVLTLLCFRSWWGCLWPVRRILLVSLLPSPLTLLMKAYSTHLKPLIRLLYQGCLRCVSVAGLVVHCCVVGLVVHCFVVTRLVCLWVEWGGQFDGGFAAVRCV